MTSNYYAVTPVKEKKDFGFFDNFLHVGMNCTVIPTLGSRCKETCVV